MAEELYSKVLPIFIEDFGSDHETVEHIRKVLATIEQIEKHKNQRQKEQVVWDKAQAIWGKEIGKHDRNSGCPVNHNDFYPPFQQLTQYPRPSHFGL